MISPVRIWIQGAGEMASGAAVHLLASGCEVLMAEVAAPHFVRRHVCFGTAVYEDTSQVMGWSGKLRHAGAAEFEAGCVVVIVDPQAREIARLAPDFVVDARMRKCEPAPMPWPADRLIGLGPGFVCGKHAALVVETMRGPSLGQVLLVGGALPRVAGPGMVGGHTLGRLLRAPVAGKFVPRLQIGDFVRSGEVVGHVGCRPVVTQLAGCIRGLVDYRVELLAGQKVGDVDPRGRAVDPSCISDKATMVGCGVVKAVNNLQNTFRTHSHSPDTSAALKEGN